jgi:hypothetical protein
VVGLDFNIVVTGFEMGEIDFRIASLEGLSEADDDPADALPEIPAGPPLSKPGDLWILGRHRVLCGSALDRQAFAMLFGDEHAAMVFTDPPYNLPIDGHASGLGAVHHRPFPMASGEMDSTQFTNFLKQAFDNLAAFTVDGSIHFVCMDWRHIDELTAAGRGVYGALKNLCVWVKDNAGMGSLYRSLVERFSFIGGKLTGWSQVHPRNKFDISGLRRGSVGPVGRRTGPIPGKIRARNGHFYGARNRPESARNREFPDTFLDSRQHSRSASS